VTPEDFQNFFSAQFRSHEYKMSSLVDRAAIRASDPASSIRALASYRAPDFAPPPINNFSVLAASGLSPVWSSIGSAGLAAIQHWLEVPVELCLVTVTPSTYGLAAIQLAVTTFGSIAGLPSALTSALGHILPGLVATRTYVSLSARSLVKLFSKLFPALSSWCYEKTITVIGPKCEITTRFHDDGEQLIVRCSTHNRRTELWGVEPHEVKSCDDCYWHHGAQVSVSWRSRREALRFVKDFPDHPDRADIEAAAAYPTGIRGLIVRFLEFVPTVPPHLVEDLCFSTLLGLGLDPVPENALATIRSRR
jgi:hypothetical protein